MEASHDFGGPGLYACAMKRVLPALALALIAAAPAQVPRYDHIFLLIEENHGFHQIIGNPAAPTLNALANTYGLATQYFSVADPSAPNYVAMLGGDVFGIADDGPYYDHLQHAPNLPAQLTAAGRQWRAYLQNLPYLGYRGICYPGRCEGAPDFGALYGTKHNGIPYFASESGNPAERRKMLPIEALAADVATNPPDFGYIVPDHCRDMHGAPPWCGDSGNNHDVNDNQLVGTGDAYAAGIVRTITQAPFWTQGRNAIVITWDEGNGAAGCCGLPGTGQVSTIVITSDGPRAVRDPTPYNHYSLLRTIEDAFALPCIAHACDAKILPMTKLFAVAP